MASFECNICGSPNTIQVSQLDRESASCLNCKSSVRMRAMIYILMHDVLGLDGTLNEMKPKPEVNGIGLSDWPVYAQLLSRRLSYTNTFFHREPRLDISNLGDDHPSQLDFIIASDVFEHIAAPVSRAFDNVRTMLNDNGTLILSVPYVLKDTAAIEHFPNIHDYEIKKSWFGPVLYNKTRDGKLEKFRRLKFHGGAGQTLEMRLFTLKSLTEHLEQAGFSHVSVFDRNVYDHGIHWKVPYSLPLVARP